MGEPVGSIEEMARHILSGTAIYVPGALVHEIPDSSRNQAGRDTAAMTHKFISVLFRAHQREAARWGGKTKMVQIHTARFKAAIPHDLKTIRNAKKWLEEKKFIKIDHDCEWGVKSKKYRPCQLTNLVPYITKSSAHGLLEEQTAEDDASEAYRRNLNQLELDTDYLLKVFKGRVFHRTAEKTREKLANTTGIQGFTWDESASFDEIESTLYAAARIAHKKGRVFRDKTGRLHSPFTQLHSSYRRCFTVNGEGLASLDMRAAQPTLLGLVSGDEGLVEHCVSDELYRKIAAINGVDRSEAKEQYCWFAYGSLKAKETEENRPVFQIQRLFEEEFPKAYSYIVEQKSPDYRKFSHEMMRTESEIFINGVFRELSRKGMFCLTIHDGIYFKASDQATRAEAEELIAQQIDQRFTGKTRKKFLLSYSTQTEETMKDIKNTINHLNMKIFH